MKLVSQAALLLGLLVVGCSSSTNNGGGNGGAVEGNNPADASTDAKAGSSSGKDAGSSTGNDASSTPTDPDAVCAAKSTAQACAQCCAQGHAQGAQIYQGAVISCACKAANCGTECNATLCAEAGASNPDQACVSCINSKAQQNCGQDVGSACQPSQPCMQFYQCLNACPQ